MAAIAECAQALPEKSKVAGIELDLLFYKKPCIFCVVFFLWVLFSKFFYKFGMTATNSI